MSYFRSFPNTLYQFGDEEQLTLFKNISLYSDVIDQVRDSISSYQLYTILDGDRPDNVSQKLYNSPKLYWTFFIMNDLLREQGWPLTNHKITVKAQKDFPNTTLSTSEDISTRFKIGQTVSGLSTGSTGTIIAKRFDFGQMIIETNDTFFSNEVISSTNSEGVLETATLNGAVVQYNSIHHYEDDEGNYVDVDPLSGSVGNVLAVTHLEHYIAQNELLKEIKVIKPSAINQVNISFNRSLRL